MIAETDLRAGTICGVRETDGMVVALPPASGGVYAPLGMLLRNVKQGDAVEWEKDFLRPPGRR